MAVFGSATITGVRALLSKMKRITQSVTGRGTDKALIRAAEMVTDEARRLVPVRSGALKKSITYELPRVGMGQVKVVLVGFKPPVSRRAHLTEFGTVHSSAKPFMRPALDSEAGAAIRAMGAEVKSVLDSEGT